MSGLPSGSREPALENCTVSGAGPEVGLAARRGDRGAVAGDVVDPVDAGVGVVAAEAAAPLDQVQRAVGAELEVHRALNVMPVSSWLMSTSDLPSAVDLNGDILFWFHSPNIALPS